MAERWVDLNCDMGESFGAYGLGRDDEMLELITSANIACGFHAGDPRVMERTVTRAAERGVGIGAHVGFPDLVGFGRRPLAASRSEEHTSELQSRENLVCRLLLEKKKKHTE